MRMHPPSDLPGAAPYISDWLSPRLAVQRLPVSASLEVTFRCNLRCAHCYQEHTSPARLAAGELSLAEIQDILDQAAAEGCLWLLLTGGEPFMRSDFLDIYAYAKRKGFVVTLFTNGTLITDRVADFLADLPPLGIEISLYGATQETYERVTGIPGSHARCIEGIERLLSRRLPAAAQNHADDFEPG